MTRLTPLFPRQPVPELTVETVDGGCSGANTAARSTVVVATGIGPE